MIISKTPLRISFTGGGTDLESFFNVHGGAVVSTTIDKSIYVVVKRRFDKKIRAVNSQTELVDNVQQITHELIREALLMTGVDHGVDIMILSDIPSEGTGLGSSSTLTVGLLNALYAFQGHQAGAKQLAEEACEIEINRLKKPIGKQDQYIAAFGGLRFTCFHRDGTVATDRINLLEDTYRSIESNLMLFYTGMTRSASNILKSQNDNTAANLHHLNFLKNQSMELMSHLRKGEADVLGEIMHQGWGIKRQLAQGITSPEIDALYHKALEAGAVGGKVAGAGGGGFLMLYVPPGAQEDVRNALPLQQMPVRLSHYGSRIIFHME
ncbi:hypothetical protein [Paenibacillus rigui]|uniref:GHMP kinase n=1 Tax=Paenibacillus rigui TaxID=554312 RepID=A0A229ULY4_9BACL|nr:hypothetical protein [Paenibacillus rigui]OXM83909.1 GHMP kinase [Paenibacillus rigui]